MVSSVPSRSPDCRHSSSSLSSAHGEEDVTGLQQDEHQLADLAKVIG